MFPGQRVPRVGRSAPTSRADRTKGSAVEIEDRLTRAKMVNHHTVVPSHGRIVRSTGCRRRGDGDAAQLVGAHQACPASTCLRTMRCPQRILDRAGRTSYSSSELSILGPGTRSSSNSASARQEVERTQRPELTERVAVILPIWQQLSRSGSPDADSPDRPCPVRFHDGQQRQPPESGPWRADRSFTGTAPERAVVSAEDPCPGRCWLWPIAG